MVNVNTIRLNCKETVNSVLGMKVDKTRIVIEDFEVTGENEDILVACTFSISMCEYLEYYINFLNGDFIINHKCYDGRLVVC